MGKNHTAEFRQKAVRVALTSAQQAIRCIAGRGAKAGPVGYDAGPVFSARDLLGGQQPDEARSGYRCSGNCYDSTAMETLFRTTTPVQCMHSPALKRNAELIWRHAWQTRRDAEVAIFECINGFYNPRRRHSALGWRIPLAFEKFAT